MANVRRKSTDGVPTSGGQQAHGPWTCSARRSVAGMRRTDKTLQILCSSEQAGVSRARRGVELDNGPSGSGSTLRRSGGRTRSSRTNDVEPW